MQVTISGAQPINATIIAPPGVGLVVAPMPTSVTISVVRDGRDGASKTFDELRTENPNVSGDILFGGVGTVGKIRDAEGEDEAVPYAQAERMIKEQQNLRQAVTNDNGLDGDIDFEGNRAKNAANAVNLQDYVTLSQLQAAQAEAEAHAEALATNAVRILGDFDVVAANAYPSPPLGSGASGAIRRNDAWRIPTSATTGTFNGVEYAPGDIIYAVQATPGQIAANWSSFDYNTQQATETARGTLMIAPSVIVGNENSLDNEKAVTTRRLWLDFWPRVRQLAHTWAARQTFAVAIRLNSVIASKWLRVDANKDVYSSDIAISDITDLTQKLSKKVEVLSSSTDWGTELTVATQEIMHSFLIPAGTLAPGNRLEVRYDYTRSTAINSITSKFWIGPTNNIADAIQIAQNTVSSGARSFPLQRTFNIQTGNFIEGWVQNSNALSDIAGSGSERVRFPINPAADIWFFATNQQASASDRIRNAGHEVIKK